MDNDDVSVSVLGKLDVKTLIRMGRVSKKFQSIVRKNGVLRAAVFNSFPGIANVPVDVMDYAFYENALKYYYSFSDFSDKDRTSALHFVRMSMNFYKDNNNNTGVLTPEKFDSIIAVFCVLASNLFTSANGREIILQYFDDWRKLLLLLIPRQDYYHHHHQLQYSRHANAVVIITILSVIDRLSTIALSSFNFRKTTPNQIFLNVASVPEIHRRSRRLSAAVAMDWDHSSSPSFFGLIHDDDTSSSSSGA